MKILVLLGSPHKKGTTKVLAEQFSEGAKSAGHTVDMIHTSILKVSPCLGCNACKKDNGKCCFNDDMEMVKEKVLSSDMIVFVSPLYYFGFTTQLKMVIDRFYAFNKELREMKKKAILISAGADVDSWAMEGIVANYKTICRYLGWENCGEVLALGCGTPEALDEERHLKEAYLIGRRL